MHLIDIYIHAFSFSFSFLFVHDLPENYDDVIIIRQFSNDKAGEGFNLHSYRLEQGFCLLFFFKLLCHINM